MKPFKMEELEIAVKEMKNNTTPAPGFSIEFFKAFWHLIETFWRC